MSDVSDVSDTTFEINARIIFLFYMKSNVGLRVTHVTDVTAPLLINCPSFSTWLSKTADC
jgi:hypothetical protein